MKKIALFLGIISITLLGCQSNNSKNQTESEGSEDSIKIQPAPHGQKINASGPIMGSQWTKPGPGYEKIYTVNAVPGETFTWIVVRGTIIQGQGTPSITVLWDPTNIKYTGTVQVLSTVNGNTTTENITVIVDPDATGQPMDPK